MTGRRPYDWRDHVVFDRRALTWRHWCPGTDDCSRCQAHIEDRESSR